MCDLDSRTPIKLIDCADPYEASAIAGALEAEGIEAIVDGPFVVFNHTNVFTPPAVRVPREDAEQAATILGEWRANVTQRRSDRIRKEQNSSTDPSPDDDLQEDRHRRDGFLWNRYGRTSMIARTSITATALVLLLLAASFSGIIAKLFSWVRTIAQFLQ